MSADVGPGLPTISEVRDALESLDSWESRYMYIMELGRRVPPLDDPERTDRHLLKGCQARVWLIPEISNGRLAIRAQSDSRLVNGLIAVVLSLYHGASVEDAIAIDAGRILADLGLDRHISPTRRNGLAAMIEKIRSALSDDSRARCPGAPAGPGNA